MKSNICALPQNASQLAEIFAEVERCAACNALSRKQALQLRLLAEEITSMLPSLLKWTKGVFWLENMGDQYELHVSLTTMFRSVDQREKLLSVATSGRNAAAAGIMGRIRCAIEEAVLAAAVPRSSEWTLQDYRSEVQYHRDSDKWAELERSIIANLADDVIVSIQNEKVDITVKKNFWAQ